MHLTESNEVLHNETMTLQSFDKNQSDSLKPVRIDGVTYFAATDLAAVLKISRQTLWRWRRAKKIPLGHRFRDGQTFFTENEVGEIREFANRIEPIDAPDRSQLELFERRHT
jgi:hypothetical protein